MFDCRAVLILLVHTKLNKNWGAEQKNSIWGTSNKGRKYLQMGLISQPRKTRIATLSVNQKGLEKTRAGTGIFIL